MEARKQIEPRSELWEPVHLTPSLDSQLVLEQKCVASLELGKQELLLHEEQLHGVTPETPHLLVRYNLMEQIQNQH